MDNRRVKNLIAIFSIILPCIVNAGDFIAPHRIQPGDVVSSDVINEILDYIQNSSSTITENSLAGTWSCTSYAVKGSMDSELLSVGWTMGDLYLSLSDVSITFTKIGGDYFFTTSVPRPFTVYDQLINLGDSLDTIRFEIISGKFIYEEPDIPQVYNYDIDRISDSRIAIKGRGSPFLALLCDKQVPTPDKPGRLSASTTGLTVTLNWENSESETGYKVYRKEPRNLNWTEITQIPSGTTSYQETLSQPGTFLYRVKATNESGDSYGTNVVKVKL